ncbi:MAG: serine protease [Kofleriaceae bacterium]
MTRPACAWLAVLLGACGGADRPRPAEPAPAIIELGPAELFARVGPSVVYVRSRFESDEAITVNAGAGVVIGPRGVILTSCHQLRNGDAGPIAPAVEVLVAEPDAQRRTFRPSPPITADVLWCLPEPDLGMIKLRGGDHGLVPVPLAAAVPPPGEWFTAIGPTHLGFMWSVQRCLVAGVGDLRDTGTSPFGSTSAEAAAAVRAGMTGGTVLQSGCYINPVSGSPAFDRAGQVIGLHLFARLNTDLQPSDVNYYLGVDEIRRYVGAVPAP